VVRLAALERDESMVFLRKESLSELAMFIGAMKLGHQPGVELHGERFKELAELWKSALAEGGTGAPVGEVTPPGV